MPDGEDKVVAIRKQRPTSQAECALQCEERYRLASAERSRENASWIRGEDDAVAIGEATGEDAGERADGLRCAAAVVGLLQRTTGRKQEKPAVCRPERLDDDRIRLSHRLGQ